MSWTALIEQVTVPTWRGPRRTHILEGDPPGRPPKARVWRPWTLLTAANEPQMRAHRDHWPLRRPA